MRTLIHRLGVLRLSLVPVVLLLVFKLSEVWEGVGKLVVAPLSISAAHASSGPPAATPTHDAPAAGPSAATNPASRAPGAAVLPGQSCPAPPFSATEAEVLQQLATRREVLDRRDQEIANRQDVLRAAEQRIEQKLTQLKELQGVLERLINTQETQQEDQLQSLVKIYENMKPKDAARIFEELEMATLLPVVERMKERKLAPIMAELNPLKAKDITTELAKLRALLSGKPRKASNAG
jgi:flagellar motility protein MotE (MotC chaperone)